MERRLQWGKGNEQTVASVEELDAAVDRLSAEARSSKPFMVTLIGEDGASLTIGLGGDVSVVNFSSAGGDPPYYQSAGEPGEDAEDRVFYFGGEWSEFPGSAGIENATAREAMRVFFRTGERPSNVGWVEV